jgi:hypothetical protein
MRGDPAGAKRVTVDIVDIAHMGWNNSGRHALPAIEGSRFRTAGVAASRELRSFGNDEWT